MELPKVFAPDATDALIVLFFPVPRLPPPSVLALAPPAPASAISHVDLSSRSKDPSICHYSKNRITASKEDQPNPIPQN